MWCDLIINNDYIYIMNVCLKYDFIILIKGGIYVCWIGIDLYILRMSDLYIIVKFIFLNYGIMM